MSVYGYDFQEFSSTPSISSSTNFNNDIKFTIEQPKGNEYSQYVKIILPNS